MVFPFSDVQSTDTLTFDRKFHPASSERSIKNNTSQVQEPHGRQPHIAQMLLLERLTSCALARQGQQRESSERGHFVRLAAGRCEKSPTSHTALTPARCLITSRHVGNRVAAHQPGTLAAVVGDGAQIGVGVEAAPVWDLVEHQSLNFEFDQCMNWAWGQVCLG